MSNDRARELVEERLKKGQWVVDPESGAIFNAKGKQLGSINTKTGYIQIGVYDPKTRKNLTIYAHQVVFFGTHGYWPEDVPSTK